MDTRTGMNDPTSLHIIIGDVIGLKMGDVNRVVSRYKTGAVGLALLSSRRRTSKRLNELMRLVEIQ